MLVLYVSMIDNPDAQKKFEQLYITYRQMMYYTANKVLNDEYEAEDTVHQAFLRVMKHLDDIDEDDERKTKSYLAIITQNIAIDMYRRRKRDRLKSVSYEAQEMYIEDPAGQDFETDIEEAEQETEEGYKLAEAIQKLSPKYADVVRLTYAHGYSSDKVGELLNISSDTVRQRLVRARKMLAEQLGGEYTD